MFFYEGGTLGGLGGMVARGVIRRWGGPLLGF